MSGKKDSGAGELVVCTNKRATRRYAIEDHFEAGMALTGSEVKSLRGRQASLDGAYASLDRGELWLHGMHIAPYEQAGPFGHEPLRARKLLVHRHEILRLTGKLARSGLTLVPLRVYFKHRRAKVELGLGKGKRKGDDRESMRRKLDLDEARAAMAAKKGARR